MFADNLTWINNAFSKVFQLKGFWLWTEGNAHLSIEIGHLLPAMCPEYDSKLQLMVRLKFWRM